MNRAHNQPANPSQPASGGSTGGTVGTPNKPGNPTPGNRSCRTHAGDGFERIGSVNGTTASQRGFDDRARDRMFGFLFDGGGKTQHLVTIPA